MLKMILILVCGTVLLAGCASGPKAITQTPEASPSAIEASPSVIEKGHDLAELVAAQEIKSGQTHEALGQEINTRLNNWMMSGTDTFRADYVAMATKAGDASDATFTKFADGYAKRQFTDVYGPALFGIKPDDTLNPGLQTIVDNLTAINSNVLQLNYVTADQAKPYTRGAVVDGIRDGEKNGDTVRIYIDITEIDAGVHLKDRDIPALNYKLTFTATLLDDGTRLLIKTLNSSGR